MKSWKVSVLTLLSFFALFFLVTGVIAFIQTENQKKALNDMEQYPVPDSMNDIISRCYGLDLINTSYCFRDNVATFFNYTSDNERYLFDENENIYFKNGSVEIKQSPQIDITNYLKENGGVCTDWAVYYYQLCKKSFLDCSIRKTTGLLDVVNGHIWILMYNSTHYCELDQLSVNCKEIQFVNYK